jgi:diguanylate cyclase (GGDEF)-like protein/PAS domain S-box-containing protein
VVRKSIHIFILLSLLFACLDIVFVWINYRSAKEALDDHFTTMSRELETAFFQALDATEQRMLQIAAFVASEPPVQKLFLAGKRAVAREGDSGTGRESNRIRKQLYALLAAPRARLAREHDFRQLQFHLEPGSLSFLRVHEPDRFGDRMDSVRHTVVTVNKYRQPVSGIETGRMHTGIRGVVPVFTAQEGRTAGEYIGALGAGTGFKITLDNAVRGRKTNMAVLLTTRHLEKNIWPDVLESLFEKRPPLHGYYIEEATSPQIMAILDVAVSPDDTGKTFAWQLLDTVDPPLLLVTMSLRDYAGRKSSDLDNIGTVVAWRPVGGELAMFRNGIRTNILYAIFGFLVTELLLYGALQVGVRKLEHLIEDGRRELARTVEQLQKSEHKFKAMAEFSVDWDVWYAVDGQAVYITPSCEEITGYPRDLFYRDPDFIVSIVHPDDMAVFMEHRRDHYVKSTPPAEATFRIIRKDGEVRWIWHKCQAVYSDEGIWQGRRTTNRDVTQQKRVEKQLHRLSTTDALTGAYNRRMFIDLLTREMQRAQRYGAVFSLIMFDIDRFKMVNDRYGHDAGDRVLVEVVEVSRKTIRSTDILSRWGGEEFMVLLPQTDSEKALAMGERLRKAIAHHSFADVDALTISVGVTSLRQLDSIDVLLKRVDEALYAAKNGGRNRVMLK